nr:hypothetical protein [Tanacetum cinerariifolium]
MSPEKKAHYESEKEEIHLLFTGIGDEFYSTVDGCKTAHEMWIAIKRLQQGESLNIQDDTTPRYKNDNQTGQFGNQRTVTVAGAKQTIGSQIDEQELEAHYKFIAKIQEVPTADSCTDTEPLKQDDSNVTPNSPDMCDNDIQTDKNTEDERVALANLIANLKPNVHENKKIQKQLKKANASLAHELKECKSILTETSKTLGESNSIQDSCFVALQSKQTEFERYKALNDRTVDYDKLEPPKGPTFNGRPTFANPMYLKKAQYEKLCLYEIPHDQSDPENRLVPDREETLTPKKRVDQN